MRNIKEKFYQWKRRLEIFSAITLIVFGFFYLIWATGPLLFDWQYQNFVLPTIFDFFGFVKSLVGM